jgi:hypothetical protein
MAEVYKYTVHTAVARPVLVLEPAAAIFRYIHSLMKTFDYIGHLFII